MTGTNIQDKKPQNYKWQSWGQTQTGPLHLKMNIPNQDAWLVQHFDWGDALVVSDGLGSKSLSDKGAKAVCDAVITMAKFWHQLPETAPQKLLSYVHENWLLNITGLDINECACTCLFVVRVHEKLFTAQLGDGLFGIYNKQTEFVLQLSAQNKEDNFSNQTQALEKKFILKNWFYLLLNADDNNAFILCTDGISDDLEPESITSFVKDIYNHFCTQEPISISDEIALWLKNWPVPKHTDDKTIACLYKKV